MKRVEFWQVQRVQSPALTDKSEKQLSMEMLHWEHIQLWSLCILGGFSGERDVIFLGEQPVILLQCFVFFFSSCVECEALQQTSAVWLCKVWGVAEHQAAARCTICRRASALWLNELVFVVCVAWPGCSLTAACVCVCVDLTNVGLLWHKSIFICLCAAVCLSDTDWGEQLCLCDCFVSVCVL